MSYHSVNGDSGRAYVSLLTSWDDLVLCTLHCLSGFATRIHDTIGYEYRVERQNRAIIASGLTQNKAVGILYNAFHMCYFAPRFSNHVAMSIMDICILHKRC